MSVKSPVACSLGLYLLSASLAWADHCQLNVQPVNFGFYDIFSPVSTDTFAGLTVNCAVGTLYRVSFSPGLYSNGQFNNRRMLGSNGRDYLRYNLFLEPAHVTLWGDGTAGSSIISRISTTVPDVLPVYGRISPLQMVSPGEYRDSIIVTVEW